MASDANDASADTQKAGNADAAQKEAYDYWGYLIKQDKCGTELFDRLLKGIAEVISFWLESRTVTDAEARQSKKFEPSDSPDLTPSQIAAFYRAVGGNYDVLFIETPPTSLSFIYRSLGAFHSLQPTPTDDGYSSPTLPALKKQGYVTWQTIQLLLGPEDHVPFLQNAVRQFDVVDPETGNLFPKVLPKECLPDKPDDAMETWYETVAARLKREAEDGTLENEKVPHVRVDEHVPRSSADMSGDSADERHAAADYFSDPLYRKSRHTRPPIIRHFSKQTVHPYEDQSRGRLISSVRHMLNPFNKRRNMPGRWEEDSLSEDDDRTPVGPIPPAAPRYASHGSQNSHKRPHPPRRESTLSSTDSDSDSDGPPSRRRSPVLRHRRSHEPATSPREYFPSHYDDRRYSHDVPGPQVQRKEDAPSSRPVLRPPPVYAPTHPYRPHNVRYTTAPPSHLHSPELVDAPYRESAYPRDRDRERDGYERYRRRSEEFHRERTPRGTEGGTGGRGAMIA
ncbi:hypothetical protein N0V90_005247 [Kalmusia sp. IMI 367209]|nr:hypothetical protein N0V90_005247 [Kalmusia sp. IMI 367209]